MHPPKATTSVEEISLRKGWGDYPECQREKRNGACKVKMPVGGGVIDRGTVNINRLHPKNVIIVA